MKQRPRIFLAISAAAILAAAILPYCSTWPLAFIADDWAHISHSKSLTFQSFLGNMTFAPNDIYYRPVAIGYFWVNYQLWGLNPTGYHIVKGLFFAGASLLLFLFIYSATGRGGAALAAGLVFALHPLNTDCAVWLATHGNVLCAFFFLLALWLYVLARKDGGVRAPFFAGFVAAMLLCFGSYELGYSLPLMALLADFLLIRKKSGLRFKEWLRRGRRAHIVCVLVAAAFLVPRFTLMEAGYGAGKPLGAALENGLLQSVEVEFLPASRMEWPAELWVRFIPAMIGFAFFLWILIARRESWGLAVFGLILMLLGVVPALGIINPAIGFGNIRYLVLTTAGFGILVGGYVGAFRRGLEAGIVLSLCVLALVTFYWWRNNGIIGRWHLAAKQSGEVVEVVTKACSGAPTPFRLVFITYPEVRGVAGTEPHFVISALLAEGAINPARRFFHDSPYEKASYDFDLLAPDARHEIVRWFPVRLDDLSLYERGFFKPADDVYRISDGDLAQTFFFYWDEEKQRLVDCTDAMRKRLAEKRDKTLFDWYASERISAEGVNIVSCECRQISREGVAYISPVPGSDLPLITVALDDTTCADFDFVEIDLTATSKSYREGYFSGYITFLLKGERKTLPELAGRKVAFGGVYYEFHENHHVYRIPLAQGFLAYDKKQIAGLLIVLPMEVKEYALRSIRLRRFDE